MESMDTHYEVLGLGRGATADDIRKAYSFQLAQCVAGSERAGKVSAAYLALSDDQKKQEYDRQLDAEFTAMEEDENPGTWFHHSGPEPGPRRRKPISEKTERAHKRRAGEPRTHYQNLHVDSKASAEVIRAAYKALAQKWHPDKNPDQREKAERYFRIISDAFQTLSDPARRAEYDAKLAAQQKEQPGAAEHNDYYEAPPNKTPPPPKSAPRARRKHVNSHHPWRRYWARTTDSILLGFAGGFLITFFPALIGIDITTSIADPLLANIVVALLGVLVLEPILVHIFSATPGKLLLGIRVTNQDDGKLDLTQSFKRSLYASIIGHGGYTIIGIITCPMAYNRLKRTGTTYWDGKASSKVTLKSLTLPRVLIGYAGVAIVMIVALLFITIFSEIEKRAGYQQSAPAQSPALRLEPFYGEYEPIPYSPEPNAPHSAASSIDTTDLEQAAIAAIEKYPFLNISSSRANQAAIDEVIALRDQFYSEGYSIGTALRMAVEVVGPRYSR